MPQYKTHIFTIFDISIWLIGKLILILQASSLNS